MDPAAFWEAAAPGWIRHADRHDVRDQARRPVRAEVTLDRAVLALGYAGHLLDHSVHDTLLLDRVNLY